MLREDERVTMTCSDPAPDDPATTGPASGEARVQADLQTSTDPLTTADPQALAAAFEAHRPYLRGVAYRLLGSLSEAEDLVQESWLRLARLGPDEIMGITELRAWLTTAVTRLSLDVLRSARVRREQYVGPWLPEPLVLDETADPAEIVGRADAVSTALLVVLETLTPAERAVFVLHDVFGVQFEEIAATVRRTPAACRQLAARARRHVAARTPRFQPTVDERRDALHAFVTALAMGDLSALTAVLDPQVVLVSDGGGVATAARRPILGLDKVIRFLFGILRKHPGQPDIALVSVNGDPGLRMSMGGAWYVLGLEVAEGRITGINIMVNPEKLRHLGPATT